MAFDRPLEADRVDDLGLLSTFIRAPIVGPILWILGKKLVEDETNEKEKSLLFQQDDTTTSTSSSSSTNDTTKSTDIPTSKNLQLNLDHGSLPDMESSALSDILTTNSSLCDEIDMNNYYITKGRSISSLEETKQNDIVYSLQHQKKKSNRKMSWSDESGQSLVEYCDLVS